MKPSQQLSLGETNFPRKSEKVTRKMIFLRQMEEIVPWAKLEARIRPFYPVAGNGRRPTPLTAMLRIHFLQQWYAHSDPAMEEALHDVQIFRQFAGLDTFEDAIPDETTILRFRHLLEKHGLAQVIFEQVQDLLTRHNLLLKEGTAVDATLLQAPSSTKNKDKKRDPEMSSTHKSGQWYFGMKAHIGVDAASGIVHSVACTTAKTSDAAMLESCLQGRERWVVADRAYHRKTRTIGNLQREGSRWIITPCKRNPGQELTSSQKIFNRAVSSIRAVVEHPFRVIKRQFGYTKVRYRGIFKNSVQIVTLMALANLWRCRQALLTISQNRLVQNT